MTHLPPEILKRIAKEAAHYMIVNRDALRWECFEAHRSGAIVEATRAIILVEAIEALGKAMKASDLKKLNGDKKYTDASDAIWGTLLALDRYRSGRPCGDK